MKQSKSTLAISISKLMTFENPKIMAEQYSTDSESAAEAAWFAFMKGDIAGKAVADLGCGTGLLGIAALLLGAEKTFFVDNDEDALEICRKNISSIGENAISRAVIVNEDISNFVQEADTVLQNPPFGTKTKHADRQFLIQAFLIAPVIYSFHKINTSDFVKKLAADNGFSVTNILPMQLQLKKTHNFHRSKLRRVEVGCFRIEKD